MSKLQLDYLTPESLQRYIDLIHSKNDNEVYLPIPGELFSDDRFKRISNGGKLLISLMLDKTAASIGNGWIDEQDRLYIIYPNNEIMSDLRIKKGKAAGLIKELQEIGLIKINQQGTGKPNIIYVMNIFDQNS